LLLGCSWPESTNGLLMLVALAPTARAADESAQGQPLQQSPGVAAEPGTATMALHNQEVQGVLGKEVRGTEGVGDATLWGPQDYTVRAWVRTDRLTGLGLTTGDIINAIKAQNVQAAVGRIGARPISNDCGACTGRPRGAAATIAPSCDNTSLGLEAAPDLDNLFSHTISLFWAGKIAGPIF